MKSQYYSVEDAARAYPVAAKTIRAAKALGIEVVRHRVSFTRYGAVRQHSFTVKEADGTVNYYTNKELSGKIKIYRRVSNK